MNSDISPPSLDAMPFNALKEVLNYLKLKERSILRKVDRTLRKAVDNNYATVNLALDFYNSRVYLTLDELPPIEYCNIGDDLRWNHLEEEFERLCETLEDFFDERARNGLEGLCIETLDVETSDGDEIAQLMTWIDVNTITFLRIHTNQIMLSDEDVEEFTETLQWQRIRKFQLVGCSDLPHNFLNNLGNVSFFSIDRPNFKEFSLANLFMFVATDLNQSENFKYGQIIFENFDLPAPLFNTYLPVGNVAITFYTNLIILRKLD
ncbi:hypothetical protein B9Z55_025981 [Caenorhabditis nigoni]|uniref:F-box domain-containing protein n=1 Tax=Caenorhabditis nigoni TaxID=1611254 RepID=A0A2G5T126_9PELO|nr:hypothetical protein B9Z55_025981 [Caenorhabditis nigoni]